VAPLPPPPPEKKPLPEPQRRQHHVRRPPTPAKAPPPNQTPKTPPKAPPKPVFGVTMSSTTEGDSSFTVPTGNTTVADPRGPRTKGPPPPPLPPAPHVAPTFVPASPLDISAEAELEEDLLSQMPYPEGEAKNLGIEGETHLRVEIDERGHVHGVSVVKSVGGGAAGAALDRLAQKTVMKYRFKPARDKAGRAVAVVIPRWKVTWKLEQ
jgi:TonB family protein